MEVKLVGLAAVRRIGQHSRMRFPVDGAMLLLLLLLPLLLLQLIEISYNRFGRRRGGRHRSVAHLLAVIIVVAVAHPITSAAVVVIHDWRMVGLLLVAGHFGRWMLVALCVDVVARRIALDDGMLLLLLLDEVLLMAEEVLLLLASRYLPMMLRLEGWMTCTVEVAAELLLLGRQLRAGGQGRRRRIAARHQRFANYSGVAEWRRSVLRSHGADHRRSRPIEVLLLLRRFRPNDGRLLRVRADVLLLASGEIATSLRFGRFSVLLMDVAGCGWVGASAARVRLLIEILAHLLLMLVMLLLLLLLLLLMLHVVDSRRIVRAGFETARQTWMVDNVAVTSGHADVNRCRSVIMLGLNHIASAASAIRRHVIRTHLHTIQTLTRPNNKIVFTFKQNIIITPTTNISFLLFFLIKYLFGYVFFFWCRF